MIFKLIEAVFQYLVSEVKSLSRVQLFAIPRTVAYQVPPSMGGVIFSQLLDTQY